MRRMPAVMFAGLVLVASACSNRAGDSSRSTTPPDTAVATKVADPEALFGHLIAEVDRLVRMVPGSGRGPQAGQLVPEMGDIVPGSADHVARVATPGGFVNIVTYRAAMQDVGGVPAGDIPFCVGVFGPSGGSAACGSDPFEEPQAGLMTTSDGPGGRNSITAYGGLDVPIAILVTDQQARIGIITVDGWAFADWPTGWGEPDTITFYDSDGEPGFHSTFGF